MKKFLDSQIKPKEDREREREERRLEREEERREKHAKKYPNGYEPKDRDEGFERFGTGHAFASSAELGQREHGHHYRRLANPAPLGLFAFGFSAFLLGLVNIGAENVIQTTALVGPFLLYTSVMMGVAAIFELIAGNTFGATAFGTLSGFFLSFGAILYPTFGTFDTFIADPRLVLQFLGLFFATWMIPFGIFTIVTIRSTWTLWLQFLFIFIALTLSTAQYLSGNTEGLRIASGAVLILVAVLAYINGAAGLIAKETTFFNPPNLAMPWAARPEHNQRGSASGGIAHHDREHGYSGHGLVGGREVQHIHPHPHREVAVHHETYGAPRLGGSSSSGIAPALAAEDSPYRA